ncbi:T9SS type A sorting domain-containing protein [Algoriphagus lutimaris]|uniref:T9SS type A sorting domain-containing protein n=1 Tax=Algoriphagus lutimaris TaxID=613197 RepID=UPI00196AC96C|nr:T9SS type A sorting domain-containing protein [Algoriphagus lutimaris]MBN3518905.1 T9SS type A sorting domain-containing protein [Algoriphagus lutimaris]
MKTILALAMASVISFSALAAVEDLRELSGVSSTFKKINVTLKSEVGDAKISIMDESGKKLADRKVHLKNTDVVVPFNLNSLPEGDYLVKIETNEEEVIYEVETIDRPIPTNQLPLMAYGKAIDDNTINLSVIGLTKPGVKVEIHSASSGELIHEEFINQPEAFKQDFYLKNLKADEVYLELTDALGRSRTLFF